VRHETGSLRTADGLSLFTEAWTPEAPKATVLATVLILHGYAEHSGRYAHVAGYLAGRGFAVHSFDYRGHGKSEGARAYLERFDLLVQDALGVIDSVADAAPHGLVLLGHSTGGAVALHCALRRHDLRALVLSSPYLRNAVPVSPATEAVARFLSRMAPRLPVIRLNSKDISRDPEVVRAYRADTLVYNKRVRARVAAELSGAGSSLEARLAELSLPLLVMCGSEDKIAALAGSRLLYDKAGGGDKTFTVYDGHYHELFNDYGKEGVLEDMASWLEARV
jgi:alpha-beta hydrolase superfamily lysophospholipase